MSILDAMAVDLAALWAFEAHTLRESRIDRASEDRIDSVISDRRLFLEFVEWSLFHGVDDVHPKGSLGASNAGSPLRRLAVRQASSPGVEVRAGRTGGW
jgi:hypothetical protein